MNARDVPIDDWVISDIEDVAFKIVRASGTSKEPVRLLFYNPDDLREYRREDGFYDAIVDGQPCLRVPSVYTDASFLQGRLADMGYRPLVVHYGENFVTFEFRPIPAK